MQRAGNAVTAKARQTENFGSHTLAGKGRITMQEKRQHLGALLERDDIAFPDLGELVLLGAGLAHDDGVDDFQMRRVGRQGQVNLVAVELAVRGSAEVVLHVAGAFDFIGLEGTALEFVEDRAMRLVHDVGQDVQTTAMGHAENNLLETFLAAALDDLLERRDQRFTAVEAEALGALVLDVDELFEALGLDQLLKDRLLAVRREFDALAGAFDALLDPGLFFGIGDVHELDAKRRAIGALQDVEHLRDRGVFQTQHVVDEDLAAVIGFGEAIGRRRELVVVLDRGGETKRVKLGMQVTAHAIGADHHDGANRIARCLQHFGFGHGLAGRSGGGFGLGLNLLFDSLLDHAPVTIERIDEIAAFGDRPVLALPGGTLCGLRHIGRIVGQRLEEGPPLIGNRRGIFLIARVKLFDIGRIRSVEEGRDQKLLVGFLPTHGVSRASRLASRLELMAGCPACRSRSLPTADRLRYAKSRRRVT